ncbi:hypothetical protein [Algoriphagus sp. A40]|uniref:hypothetical protein n=1 Tax=Algoriphagus sp. A40 TaxID=1945863 RepID=UPI00098447CA|nr:hypothetical protein [Algoriphagus sp. A40]OOG76455.1 hypothetical protein B0E43_08160 [Algoriphagus sp. A40]
MIPININRVQLDLTKQTKWSLKAQVLLLQLENAADKEARDKVIDDNSKYWKLFKNHLKKVSFNKCWYSDSINPASHYHVDHFRPKKKVINYDKSERDGYWWLAFEVSNFRLSGSVPNSKKGNYFAVKLNMVLNQGPCRDELIYFLDPLVPSDTQLINFQEDGSAIESAPIEDEPWHHKRAEYTIEYFDLNYEDLVEARMTEWAITTKLIKKINEKILEFNQEITVSLQTEIDGLKDQCRERIASCTNLASTNRACLRASGKRWAFELLEENVDEKNCEDR